MGGVWIGKLGCPEATVSEGNRHIFKSREEPKLFPGLIVFSPFLAFMVIAILAMGSELKFYDWRMLIGLGVLLVVAIAFIQSLWLVRIVDIDFQKRTVGIKYRILGKTIWNRTYSISREGKMAIVSAMPNIQGTVYFHYVFLVQSPGVFRLFRCTFAEPSSPDLITFCEWISTGLDVKCVGYTTFDTIAPLSWRFWRGYI